MRFILSEDKEGVFTITLNRPEKFNSFCREMALEFHETLDYAAENETIRCVVITGAGKAFCAGQDLQEATDPNGPTLTDIVSQHYNPAIMRIRNLEKPVIAAVNGVAAGAGANIALACDIVVAAESVAFIQAFSKIGLIPDSGGTFFLPRLVGMQRATALMMTGDKISAIEAQQMGMIYKVWPDEAFADAVASMASKMSAMPTVGLALTKKALNLSYGNTLEEQLALEDALQHQAGQTADYAEGTRAFLEKRTPVFKGM